MAQTAFYQRQFQNSRHQNRAEFSPVPRSAGFESLIAKPEVGCCPHCQQVMHDHGESQTTIQRIKWAVVQLFSAVVAIVFCALRLARLAVAVAFSVVGVLGFGLQTFGSKIVHPDDRRLLPRFGNSQSSTRDPF